MLKGYTYNKPDYSPKLSIVPLRGRWSVIISEPLDYTVVQSYATRAEAQAFLDGLRFAERARAEIMKENAA